MRRIMSMEADSASGSDDIGIDMVADLSWECEEGRRHIVVAGSVGLDENVKMWKSIHNTWFCYVVC